MPYVTSLEKLALEEGIEKGLKQGLEQGIEKGIEQGLEQGQARGLAEGIALAIEMRFGRDGQPLMEAVMKVRDFAVLSAVQDKLRSGTPMEALRELLSLRD